MSEAILIARRPDGVTVAYSLGAITGFSVEQHPADSYGDWFDAIVVSPIELAITLSGVNAKGLVVDKQSFGSGKHSDMLDAAITAVQQVIEEAVHG